MNLIVAKNSLTFSDKFYLLVLNFIVKNRIFSAAHYTGAVTGQSVKL